MGAFEILWRIINCCSFACIIAFYFSFIVCHLHGEACPASSNAVPCVHSHCIWITGIIFDKQAETHTLLYFSITILHGRGLIWIPTCPLSCSSSLKLSATDGWSSWKAASDGKLCFQLRIGLSIEFVVPLLPILDELSPFWMLVSCQALGLRPYFPILVSEIRFERKASWPPYTGRKPWRIRNNK